MINYYISPKNRCHDSYRDDTLKTEQIDVLPNFAHGMSKGLRDLIAEHEGTAIEPVRLNPGSPSLYVPIEELWVLEEAQEKVREIYASSLP